MVTKDHNKRFVNQGFLLEVLAQAIYDHSGFKSQRAIPNPLLLAKLDEVGRPLLSRLDLRIVPQLARLFGHDFAAAEKEAETIQ